MKYNPHSWPASWILSLIGSGCLHDFYISPQWRRVRDRVLREQHGECQDCAKRGRVVKATTVHHEHPLRQRPDLALSLVDERGKRQLTAICESCHWNRHHKKRAILTQERW